MYAAVDPGVAAGRDPFAAFRFPNYRAYLTGRTVAAFGEQMLGVAVGWEVYERTHSATALGVVGLVQALPIFVLALAAGHVADRFNRRNIALICQAITGVGSFALALISARRDLVPANAVSSGINRGLEWAAEALGGKNYDFSDPAIPFMYVILLILGVVKTFALPARAAMIPQLVPIRAFPNAVTWNSSAFQVSSVGGPAVGGFLVAAFGSPFVYALDGAAALVFFFLLLPVRLPPVERTHHGGLTLASLGAGVRFVWANKVLLGAVSLDMLAVLMGGATALLPIFAEQLDVGAVGLGWLRAAPAIGAFVTGVSLAFLPPIRKAGRLLLWVVIGFGAATIAFGFSQSYALSLLLLGLTGAFDNISVVIRHTLVQLLPPDDMRGRVSAINTVFIGTSNYMGDFRAGATAEVWGHILSVVIGGVGTLLVVLLTAWLFPGLRRFGALESAGAEAVEAESLPAGASPPPGTSAKPG
jgi:MFS family permease